MKWRTTLWLLLIAVSLGAFIVAVERPARLARNRPDENPPLLPFLEPAHVAAIQILTPSNRVSLLRTNGLWIVGDPVNRRAHPEIIEGLLRQIANLRARSILTPQELAARANAAQDFGLSEPAMTIAMATSSRDVELRVGARNVNDKEVFFQVADMHGIFLADAEIFNDLPGSPEGWRDTTLVPVETSQLTGIRVAGDGAAFALQCDTPGGPWRLSEPRPARADTDRVEMLLRKLGWIEILRFVAPTSAPPIDATGLEPPRLTLSLSRGGAEVFGLQLGSQITNASALYARRPGEDELLVVPEEILGLLRISYKDLLDRRLLRFDPAQAHEITVQGREEFRLARLADEWRIFPADAPADPELVQKFLAHLSRLEIMEIAKEVVTDLDLPRFGLAPPARRIVVRAAPGDTNATLGTFEIGHFQGPEVYARVPNEDPVYSLNPAQVAELPDLGWRLRDRRVWKFSPEQVSALSVSHEGLEWTLRHAAPNDWIVPPGWLDDVNPFALEEAVYNLGKARALSWVGEGDDAARALGTDAGPQVQVEFRTTPPTPPLRISFGKSSPAGNRYVTYTAPDGARLTFELPGAVYANLWREIGFSEPARALPR